MTRITGTIYALDLGVRTGVAFGVAGKPPAVTALRLKKPGEHRAVAFGALLDYLVAAFEQSPPGLVAKERMWSLGASAEHGNSEDVVRVHAGLHAVVEAVCLRYGVPWTEAADSTIRKHFIGRGRTGDRKSTKAAVLARCHLLGILPKYCEDDNLADACAVHDWAAAAYGRVSASTRELFLFGEHARGAA